MRLRGQFYTLEGRPVQVSLKVQTDELPPGARVAVTDVQLQRGADASGFTVNPEEALRPLTGHRYFNGVVNRDMPIILMSNTGASVPSVVEVAPIRPGTISVGMYRFGRVEEEATVDGEAHFATQGWGRPPIVTERCDLALDVKTTSRLHLKARWTERDYSAVPDTGRVTVAHELWADVVSAHHD